MPTVGYYSISSGQGDTKFADELQDGGHTAVNLSDLTPTDLSGIDALYALNPSNGNYGSEFLGALPDIFNAVAEGMSLIIFDRYVSEAETILPNGNALTIVRDFSDSYRVEVALDAPDAFVNGPAGTITDDMLDNGSRSTHGYVERSSLPDGAVALLTTTDPDHIVAFSYPHGEGTVFYSTIPLDYYSGTNHSGITAAEVSILVNNALALTLEGLEPEPLVSADEIFAQEGKMSFLGQLALAAYHLADDEVVRTLRNDFKPNSEIAFGGDGLLAEPEFSDLAGYTEQLDFTALTEYLDLFDHADLGLAPPTASGDIDFVNDGLRNGIFTNQNAAALVGRADDAVFLSFRGTNDAKDAPTPWYSAVAQDTPDKAHWIGKDDHFDLLKGLVDALQAYVTNAANGISKIYVTGHSLGAAMIEKLMRYWSDWDFDVEALAFASPGYGLPELGVEERLTNLWIDGDPIQGAAFFANNEGDRNTIFHNLDEGDELVDETSLHSMSLYHAYTRFLEKAGVEFGNLVSLAGHNYKRIFAFAEVIDEDDQIFEIGTGDDLILSSIGKDIVLGGRGEDTIYAWGGRDYLDGGKGDDEIYGSQGANTIFGRGGDDEIYGDKILDLNQHTAKPILEDGRYRTSEGLTGGKDTIDGGKGDDTIYGGHDSDSILGGEDDDEIYGNSDKDTLLGGDGMDTIFGGKGDDSIIGGDHADSLEGGKGEDTIYGLAGDDTLHGGNSDDTLSGGSGLDSLYGDDGDDSLSGGSKADHLFGGKNDDSLKGDTGEDTLEGGKGSDTLNGGAGRDVLTGGKGGDVFVFSKASDSPSDGGLAGADLITDFNGGVFNDQIDLSAIDAQVNVRGHQSFDFIGSDSFSGTAGELNFYHSATQTVINADRDGDGAADFFIVLDGNILLFDNALADHFML